MDSDFSHDDILNEHILEKALAHQIASLGLKVFYFDETDSTNKEARRQADFYRQPKLFVAENQTAGRGRLGRAWLTEPGRSLAFSLLFDWNNKFDTAANITLKAGLSLRKAISSITSLRIGIKWPNDLLVMPHGRKFCGILTEMIWQKDQPQAVIIGVGINVNIQSFTTELKNTATSLSIECGRPFSRLEILHKIIEELGNDFIIAPTEEKDRSWLAEYRRYCVTLGKDVAVYLPNGDVLFGHAKDIDFEGNLVLVLKDGSDFTCHAGEVSIRGLHGYSKE